MTVIKSGFGAAESSKPDVIVGKSLRFRDDVDNYLERQFPGSRTTFTFSVWIKRGKLGGQMGIFGWSDHTNISFGFNFEVDNTLQLYDFYHAYQCRLVTKQKFEDTTAFYHIVWAVNSTLANAADRQIVYINGVRVTDFLHVSPVSQNQVFSFSNNWGWDIGRFGNVHADQFSGLMSDFYYLDGVAATADSFGEFTPEGTWRPKRTITVSYGTQGFHLPMNNATPGVDKSGLGHDFSTRGYDFTWPGLNYDRLADGPESSLPILVKSSGIAEISNGNIEIKGVASSAIASVNFPSSGKWYLEVVARIFSTRVGVGICNTSPAVSNEITYFSDGKKSTGGVESLYGAAFNNAQTIGVAVDCGAGIVTFYREAVSQGRIPFSASSLTSSDLSLIIRTSSGGDHVAVNFGQIPFFKTPPAGYHALSTANRPVGSIKTSGTFTGNANNDGPYVWLNGTPKTMSINGNAVIWGVHANKLAGGFKLKTNNPAFNAAGSNTYNVTVTGNLFGDRTHAPNNAQLNP